MNSLHRSLSQNVLCELRKQGMTQKTLANRAGITEKHLSHMLTGRAQGTLEMWQQLAVMLGGYWNISIGGVPVKGRLVDR